MMVKGVNGQVDFDGNCVSITRKGFFGFISRNECLKIPIEKLSYIQLKKQGMEHGFINFVMAGSPQVSNVKQARKDPTCITIYPYQYKNFLKFKEAIESAMATQKSIAINNMITNPNRNDADIISFLEKLSELKDKGIITDEEFQKKKNEILNKG